MSTKIDIPARRRLLRGGLAAACLGLAPCAAMGDALVASAPIHDGPVNPPIAFPDLAVTLSDGTPTRLAALLAGKVTAVQLIFTACTTTCPMQGAIFRRVQRQLAQRQPEGMQLLSLSIDPGEDTPEALATWLQRFDAAPGWVAARPDPAELDRLLTFYGGGRRSIDLDVHATQVGIVNRRGGLVWLTNELPSPESVVRELRRA